MYALVDLLRTIYFKKTIRNKIMPVVKNFKKLLFSQNIAVI